MTDRTLADIADYLESSMAFDAAKLCSALEIHQRSATPALGGVLGRLHTVLVDFRLGILSAVAALTPEVRASIAASR